MIPDREKEPQVLFLSVWKPHRPETGKEAVFMRSGSPFARTCETFLIPGPVVAGVRLNWALMNLQGLKTSANQ